MPRKRHVSRNVQDAIYYKSSKVMPRKRHVSRNISALLFVTLVIVMPRKRHVSRNQRMSVNRHTTISHASQEACE